MYDKASRDLKYNTGSTPHHVGPGTYEVNHAQISGKAGKLTFHVKYDSKSFNKKRHLIIVKIYRNH